MSSIDDPIRLKGSWAGIDIKISQPLTIGVGPARRAKCLYPSLRQTGELCPNLPKSSIPPQKIKVDNQTRFR
jgi:hypothetical protein